MTLNQFIGLLIILGAIVGVIAGYWYILRKSENPRLILVKTIVTIALIAAYVVFMGPTMRAGGIGAIFGILVALVLGLIVAIIWREHLINVFSQPFVNMFTGGEEPPDAEPFYSIARAKRKHSRTEEAIRLIQEQLEEFPNDFNGLMLMAEIQAVDQQNLSGAAETVELICESQAGHPRNVATALTALADWHLQVYRDREAALACFERIRNTFPKHRVAMDAAQRIAHLPSQEMMDARVEGRHITLKQQQRVVIRDRMEVKVEVKRESPDDIIARLQGQIELHPMDREAREQLATLLADHAGNLGAAVEQLEFLVRQPQLDKHAKVKLLNRMTDLQVQFGEDLRAAEAPLQRIMDMYPGSPMAEQASRRKLMLKKEFQGKQKSQGIRLGSYEKDLGLRG